MDERELRKRKKRRKHHKKRKPIRKTANLSFNFEPVVDFFKNIIKFANENKMVYVIAVTVVALITVVVVGIVKMNKPATDEARETKLVMVGVDEEGKPVYEERKVSSGDEEAEDDPVVLAYKANAKAGYMNNCIFLGDSRTVAAVSYGFLSDSNVLAQVGISHTAVASTTFTQNSGQQYTLESYLKSHQMPVVYINYGVNGMKGVSEEKYESTYEDLIDKIISLCPNSNIVLMGIWPVDDYGTYEGNVKNEWINTYNAWLLKIAEEKGLHYLDVETILKGDDGQIDPKYDAGVGLHYRASAYNDIIDYIIHHPVPGVSDDGDFVVHYVAPSGDYKKIMTEKPTLPPNATEVSEKELLLTPSPVVVTEPTPTPTPVPEPVKVVATPTAIPTVTQAASPSTGVTSAVTPTRQAEDPSPSAAADPSPTQSEEPSSSQEESSSQNEEPSSTQPDPGDPPNSTE